MEKVINLLYDIEEKATRIIDRVTDEKAILYDKLNKDLEALDLEIEKETHEKLSSLQETLDREVSAETQDLITNNEKTLRDLELNFNTNKEDLVNQVFHNIIGE